MIAIGRSRLLYSSISYLWDKGYSFDAIITDTAYEEYDVKESDFMELASRVGARFFLIKNLSIPEVIDFISKRKIDIAISVNWGSIIDSSFISLFKNGIFNLHLGNLPNYKGNATPNWAIISGEKFIYVNIHKMDIDVDSGDILSRAKIEINNDTYVADILSKTCNVGPLLFEEAIKQTRENPNYFLEAGSKKGLRCYPRLPEYSQINWMDSGENIHRLIRASSQPYSGAYTFFDNKKIIIWRANIVKPENPFLAVPGHIVKINKDSGSVFVACKDSFIEVTEIEVEKSIVKPASLFKSIRLRFHSL
jgi:methionyl-tRNA formyltransferase